MGRWDVEKRTWNMDAFWMELRQGSLKLIQDHLKNDLGLDILALGRVCFAMAVKGEEGCELVKDERLKEKLRGFWIGLLQKYGSVQEGLEHVAPGQPFYLRLMKELLAFGHDADREFLLQGEMGFPVGVLSPLPSTPHMYEEQSSWRLEDDPYMRKGSWRSSPWRRRGKGMGIRLQSHP